MIASFLRRFVKVEIMISNSKDEAIHSLIITFLYFIPNESRVNVISFTTSGEYTVYREDFSLHLNLSPDVSAAILVDLMDKDEDLVPVEGVKTPWSMM